MPPHPVAPAQNAACTACWGGRTRKQQAAATLEACSHSFPNTPQQNGKCGSLVRGKLWSPDLSHRLESGDCCFRPLRHNGYYDTFFPTMNCFYLFPVVASLCSLDFITSIPLSMVLQAPPFKYGSKYCLSLVVEQPYMNFSGNPRSYPIYCDIYHGSFALDKGGGGNTHHHNFQGPTETPERNWKLE